MARRRFAGLLTILALVALIPASAAAQAGTPPTPWGDPDLQGVWDFRTITPMERPEDRAEQEFLTPEEAAALEQAALDRNADLAARPSIPLATLKQVLNETYEAPLSAGLRNEGQAFEKIRFGEAFTRGIEAFLSKKKPDFSDI